MAYRDRTRGGEERKIRRLVGGDSGASGQEATTEEERAWSYRHILTQATHEISESHPKGEEMTTKSITKMKILNLVEESKKQEGDAVAGGVRLRVLAGYRGYSRSGGRTLRWTSKIKNDGMSVNMSATTKTLLSFRSTCIAAQEAGLLVDIPTQRSKEPRGWQRNIQNQIKKTILAGQVVDEAHAYVTGLLRGILTDFPVSDPEEHLGFGPCTDGENIWIDLCTTKRGVSQLTTDGMQEIGAKKIDRVGAYESRALYHLTVEDAKNILGSNS